MPRQLTTTVNVAKLLSLENMCPGFEDIFATIMDGRRADEGIGVMLGGEFGHLIDQADRICRYDRRGAQGSQTLGAKTVVPRICGRYSQGEDCKWGDDCTHLHVP